MSPALANSVLQRAMPWLAPCSLIAGLLFGGPLSSLTWAVPWIFAVMTFTSGLALRLSDLKRIVTHPFFLVIHLVILYIALPVCTWIIAGLLFDDPLIIMGFVIISLVPVGSTSLIWVGIYRGNVALALAVIVIDTLIVPFFMPFMLGILAGAEISMDRVGIMTSLALMILLPTLLAIVVNSSTQGRAAKVLSPWLSLLSKIGIVFLLLINGGVASPYFHDPDWQFIGIVLFIFCLCCSGYVATFLAGKRLFSRRGDIMAFMLSGGIRNVGAGAAIAMLHFPPLTCLTVVIGMMFQQILGYNAGLIADRLLPADTEDAADS